LTFLKSSGFFFIIFRLVAQSSIYGGCMLDIYCKIDLDDKFEPVIDEPEEISIEEDEE